MLSGGWEKERWWMKASLIGALVESSPENYGGLLTEEGNSSLFCSNSNSNCSIIVYLLEDPDPWSCPGTYLILSSDQNSNRRERVERKRRWIRALFLKWFIEIKIKFHTGELFWYISIIVNFWTFCKIRQPLQA